MITNPHHIVMSTLYVVAGWVEDMASETMKEVDTIRQPATL